MEMQDLPRNWVVSPLQEIAIINPTLNKSTFDDDLKVSFVPMPAVEAETGKIDVSQTKKFGEVKKGYTPFQEGDVLFAKITPCMENGKMAVVPALSNSIGFGSTEFHVLRAYNGVEPRFIYYFVSSKSFRYDAEHHMTGAVGQRRVPTIHIEKSILPLPPLKEQKRIVAKIEELFSELDKGIESLKTAREQLKVYRQAVLKHAFEGKFTAKWREENEISEEWKNSELGKCGKWQGGGTPSKSVDAYWSNGDIHWISPKDMKYRIIRDSQQKITALGVENSSAKITTGKALLFVVRSGILRRVLPLAIAVSGVTVNQDMQALVPTAHIVEFLYWYCEANEQTIRHQCSKDGTTVESIEVSELKRFPVPLPTLQEQEEIVRLIETQISVIEKMESIIDAELNKSEALRQSILKKAFSGKLVSQDPDDEPASVLLERIRAEKEDQSDKRSLSRNGKGQSKATPLPQLASVADDANEDSSVELAGLGRHSALATQLQFDQLG